ncbi:MoaD/ThiS family protein [Chloroflexota bacterium]
MSIQAKFNPFLAKYTSGQRTAEVNGNTVSECLKDIVAQFPDTGKALFDEAGKLRPQFTILADGELVYAKELDKPISDGGKITIISMFGGG